MESVILEWYMRTGRNCPYAFISFVCIKTTQYQTHVQVARDLLPVWQQNKRFGLFRAWYKSSCDTEGSGNWSHIFRRQWKGKQATRNTAFGWSHFSWMKNWVCCAEELALPVQSPESQWYEAVTWYDVVCKRVSWLPNLITSHALNWTRACLFAYFFTYCVNHTGVKLDLSL
jgi:hypothetical protein